MKFTVYSKLMRISKMNTEMKKVLPFYLMKEMMMIVNLKKKPMSYLNQCFKRLINLNKRNFFTENPLILSMILST